MIAPTRLRPPGAVRAVFRDGRAARGRAAMVRVRARGDAAPARVTVSASRAVGTAVARNRAKRRLRAALRQVGPPAGHDVVVVARPETLAASLPDLVDEVAALLARVAPTREPRR